MIRTFVLAIKGINLKLNAHSQVMIKNLQKMHGKSLPPTGARRRPAGDGA
jgi:hypothetical protein